jgi:hypothetical protein
VKAYRTLLTIRDGECRYVIGEPDGAQTLYCSDPVIDRKSYCSKHAAIVFEPIDDVVIQDWHSHDDDGVIQRPA